MIPGLQLTRGARPLLSGANILHLFVVPEGALNFMVTTNEFTVPFCDLPDCLG
jgi:hypothetical protein